MRRMIANAQQLEKLAKELIYNDKTNTTENGGNLEVDGNLKVNGTIERQLLGTFLESTEKVNWTCYIVPFTGDYGLISAEVEDGTKYAGVYSLSNSDLYECVMICSDGVPFLVEIDISQKEIITDYIPTDRDVRRFNHLITFRSSDNQTVARFYGVNDNNTPIDSFQDLSSQFRNRTLPGSGIYGGSSSGVVSGIRVGTGTGTTEIFAGLSSYPLPSGFTITDEVTLQ